MAPSPHKRLNRIPRKKPRKMVSARDYYVSNVMRGLWLLVAFVIGVVLAIAAFRG